MAKELGEPSEVYCNVSVNLTPKMLIAIKKLKDADYIVSRSEFIRGAVMKELVSFELEVEKLEVIISKNICYKRTVISKLIEVK